MNATPREDILSNLLPPAPKLTLLTQIDLWEWAVGHYRELLLEGAKSSEAVERTARMLRQRAPSISESDQACRRQLYRKIDRVMQEGCIADKRGEANKKKRLPALSQSDEKAIYKALAQCGGELDFAWRTCLSNKTISQELMNRYPKAQGRRTRAPKVVQLAFPHAKVKRFMDLCFRPKRARQTGPYIPNTYADIFAGDWRCADDFTLELNFVGRDGTLRRGQLILEVDVRSKRILNFGLIDAEGYRQDEILRTLFASVKEFGLPREGWLFESGTWESGKMMAYGTIDSIDGLRKNFADRLGLKIRNCLPAAPRGKPVENIGKALQCYIRKYKNWVGPDEKRLKFEDAQRALAAVRSGRASAQDVGIPTFEDWVNELQNNVIPEYNSTAQESRLMGGDKIVFMSPDAAWEEFQPRDANGNVVGTNYLSKDLEWLFYHKETVTVGRNGIRLPYAGGAFYLGPDTGKFYGQQVFAYVNPDDFSAIIISDLKQETFYAVPRLAPISRFNASSQDIKQAHEQMRSQDESLRMIVRQIKSENTFKIPERTIIPTDGLFAARDIGQKMASARAEMAAPLDPDWVRSPRSYPVPLEPTRAEAAEWAERQARAEEVEKELFP